MKTYKPPKPSSFYPSIEHNKAYMQQNIHDVAECIYLGSHKLQGFSINLKQNISGRMR